MANQYEMIITNGKIFLPTGLYQADLGIKNGKVAGIGELDTRQADLLIDARDQLVLPGMIDPHIHFQDYDADADLTAIDDFHTASVAAAFGGNTTLLDFAEPVEGKKAADTAAARRANADGQVAVDYSLHVAVDQNEDIDGQYLSELPGLGISSVKAFTTFGRMTDDWEITKLCAQGKENNLLVMLHAENASLIRGYESELAGKGDFRTSEFPASRPELTEVMTVQQAILIAEYTGAAVYIVHISSGKAVQLIREAQHRGLPVLGETGPHYLLLTDDVYSLPDGPAFLCCPPIRTMMDNAALWAGLADGTISTIGSDHCGFSLSQKMLRKDDFRTNIKGLPTLESRVPIMFSEGVVAGRISLSRFVEVMSTNAAKIFGLYPQKGALLPGSDADVCILDPRLEWKISAKDLHVDWGWSPFEGMKVTGKPVMTMLRGKIVTDRERYLGRPGDGQFLYRPPFNFPVFS